ncbi:hypothetical protein FACS1894190_14110 [Spirochaetia bacterium]|nr:hypothetical protein FACS1894190_14110 [Spirochaetia bacterium]
MDICPKCGEPLTIENIPQKKTTNYNDCIKKCKTCGIGISNSKTNQTIIYKNFKDNIPKSLHYKLDDILKLSINQVSHKQKIIRMGFVTSEDTLSWIFFSYFIKNNKTDILLKLLGFKIEEVVDIYFWGVSYNDPSINNNFRKTLVNILKDKFNEEEKYYSEPDIIIETKTKIMFIEVKYNSENSTGKVEKIKKYLKKEYFLDFKKANKSLYYELIRNWSIGNVISKNKEYYLLNIGLKRNFDKENTKENIILFHESLNNKNNFIRLTWDKIVENMNNEEIDLYFITEMNKKIFGKANGHIA